MGDKAWKQRERKAASLFGCVRNALSGGNSKISRADAIKLNEEGEVQVDFPLFIEVKLRKKHSVITLHDSTAELAKKEKKTPVVILAEKNRPGFWILCKDSDLELVASQMSSSAGESSSS